MRTFYYLLRGDSEETGFGEVRALVSIYANDYRFVECYTSICIFQHDDSVYGKVIRRSGFVKEAGEVVDIVNLDDVNPSFLRDFIENSVVKIKVFKNTCSAKKIWRLIEKTSCSKKISSRDKFFEKTLYCSENKLILGEKPLIFDLKEMDKRKPSLRPFFRSIALKPSIARLLINLARVKEGEVLLDPFAGTGSIPLEAGVLGVRFIAVDLDRNLVDGMEKNLKYYGAHNGVVIHSDSTELAYSYIDGIATDPPYGRSTKTFGDKVVEIYREFLNIASTYLRKHGFISFLAPAQIEDFIDESIYRNDLILYDKHYLYVHGGLTRVIYEVLKC